VEEAIAINSANALAIAAFSLSSGFTQHLDWPHLIIIYHFVLLVKFSCVSYNTPLPNLRRSVEFGPLMEHLAIVDLMVMPFFIMISGTLWLGLFLARERFAATDCILGNWVLFGKVVDLKTGNLFFVGGVWATLLVGWSVICTVVDMFRRQAAVKTAAKVVHTIYGDDRASTPRPLPPEVNIEVTGDFCSALLWRVANRTIGNGYTIRGHTIGVREIVFCWRFCIWVYLIVASEQIIAANNFSGDNSLTYGQIFSLILLFVPFGILWSRCYRKFPKFARFFDSIQGHRFIWYTIGGTLSLSYAAAVYALNEDACVQRTVWAIAIVCCILPEYVRSQCSQKFDELLGNRASHRSSYWEVWSAHLQLRLPRLSGELKDSDCLRNEENTHSTDVHPNAVIDTKKLS
jgi:hypothetical protein